VSGELQAEVGSVPAAAPTKLVLPARPTARGTYVLAVSLAASTSDDRRSLYLSPSFRVR
jgi:hypothetical protein